MHDFMMRGAQLPAPARLPSLASALRPSGNWRSRVRCR